MWIGTWSKRINDEKFKNFAGLTWTDEDLKFLGENIDEDLDEQINNIDNAVKDMIKSLHFWGKKYSFKKETIRVIKTYVLSKMFYDTETQTPKDDEFNQKLTRQVYNGPRVVKFIRNQKIIFSKK